MKVRLTENHIRVRLRRSDLKSLLAKGAIALGLTFPDGTKFGVCLSLSKSTPTLIISKNAHQIEIMIPQHSAMVWASTNQVGFYESIDIKGGAPLSIAIEKDLGCSDEPADDYFSTATKSTPK